MKKNYKPSRSDIQNLYYIQSIEKEIESTLKQGRQIKMGLIISGIFAFIMVIFYSSNELTGFLVVPFIFFLFFYFFHREDESNLKYKIKDVYEHEKRVECNYIIDNYNVYIIQEDGKRIELNQY